MCQSNVRKMYANLYACEWKIDGSGVMISSKARIEVIDIDNSDDVEVIDTINNPNFKQRQSIALNRYKSIHQSVEISYQNYMKNNKISYDVPETKRHSSRLSNKPNRYGQDNLTVNHVLLSNKLNMSSGMSVVTMDKLLVIDKESSVTKGKE